MKNNPLILLFILFVIFSGHSDSVNTPVTESVENILFNSHDAKNEFCDSCVTIGRNARSLIMELYKDSLYDSIGNVLRCWEHLCAKQADIRLRMLEAIRNSEFKEVLIDSTQYQELSGDLIEYLVNCYHENPKIYDDFTKFIQQYAQYIAKHLDTNSSEYIYALYYGGLYDRFYQRMQDSIYQDLKLYQLYVKDVRRTRLLPALRIGFFTEGWHPATNRELFRNNLQLGAFIGCRWLGSSLDITFGRRYGDVGHSFPAYHDGDVDTCTYYSAIHFGLDFMAHALKINRHEVDLSIGIGVESLSAEKASITAFPVYPGIGYRFFAGKNQEIYFGIHVRYMQLNFRDDGGSNPKTEGFSIRIFYGFSDYFFRNSKMKSLGYEK